MTQENLILLLQQGSQMAFGALYKTYWRKVYNFSSLYLKDSYVAEEVVQEVFIKVWERREFIDANANFEGLLFIITRNFIFNTYRKSINEEFYKVSIINALEESSNLAEEEIETRNLQSYIDQLIEEMPPRRREIFIMSRKQQKSYHEIAESLHISEKTVENQIGEALKFLKKNLILLSFF